MLQQQQQSFEFLRFYSSPALLRRHTCIHLYTSSQVPDPANIFLLLLSSCFALDLINPCRGVRLPLLQQPMKVSSPNSLLSSSSPPLCSSPFFLQTNLQVQMQEEEVDKREHAGGAQRGAFSCTLLDQSTDYNEQTGIVIRSVSARGCRICSFYPPENRSFRGEGIFPNVENIVNDIQTRHFGLSFSLSYWQSYRKYKQTWKKRDKLAQGNFNEGVIWWRMALAWRMVGKTSRDPASVGIQEHSSTFTNFLSAWNATHATKSRGAFERLSDP